MMPAYQGINRAIIMFAKGESAIIPQIRISLCKMLKICNTEHGRTLCRIFQNIIIIMGLTRNDPVPKL